MIESITYAILLASDPDTPAGVWKDWSYRADRPLHEVAALAAGRAHELGWRGGELAIYPRGTRTTHCEALYRYQGSKCSTTGRVHLAR
jgi:hypothetical protein